MALQKSTITVVVLHEVGDNLPHPKNLSLEDIAQEMNDGLFVGQMKEILTVDVPESEEINEQLALGSDGTFFDLG